MLPRRVLSQWIIQQRPLLGWKNMPYSRVKKLFRPEYFVNLWRIYTFDFSNQHAKFRRPTLSLLPRNAASNFWKSSNIRVKKFFRCRFFWNLWRINTLNAYIQHAEFHGHAMLCCREMLPQKFQNSAKLSLLGLWWRSLSLNVSRWAISFLMACSMLYSIFSSSQPVFSLPSAA